MRWVLRMKREANAAEIDAVLAVDRRPPHRRDLERATPGGAHAPSPTATRAGTSSAGSGWSSGSSFATATRPRAPAPGSSASASAASPAAPAFPAPPRKPPDRRCTSTRTAFMPVLFPPNRAERRVRRARSDRGPERVRTAPFPRIMERADDRPRHHLRRLHPSPERARRSAQPARAQPAARDRLGPSRMRQEPDRTAGGEPGRLQLHRRPRAHARPRRPARHPMARRRRPHPLGAPVLPAAHHEHRALPHQPGGARLLRADGPGLALPADPGAQVRRVRAPARRLDHRLQQPRRRSRRHTPHAHPARQPLRAPRAQDLARGLVRLGRRPTASQNKCCSS